MLSNMISSHVRISYRFYQFVTTLYTTPDFYIINRGNTVTFQIFLKECKTAEFFYRCSIGTKVGSHGGF